MSDSSDRLSERLREQVAALHEPEAGESPALGRDAQRRVVQQLMAEASRLERRRRQRVWLGSGVGALALAAAVLLAYVRSAEPAPGAQLTAATPVQPDCRLPIVTSAELSAQTFALGGLGELVSQPGTQLSVESSSPCELALRLSSGTLAGDLHSLRPARLLIRTDHGEVIVTGTRFSVHSDAELEVLLETGVVDVQLQGAGKLRLQPRTRLHKGERAALSNDDARRLDGWLKPAPPAPPPVVEAAAAAPAAQVKPLFESSTAALTAAEAAWRAERWTSAREAYRFASQAKDSNAEIALLRWARFELDQTAPATALRLVAEHKRRFARGVLGADARFIEVQAHKALGHGARAEQAARALIKRYPDTPQAAAARKLIEVE
jgi:hypothetical protein